MATDNNRPHHSQPHAAPAQDTQHERQSYEPEAERTAGSSQAAAVAAASGASSTTLKPSPSNVSEDADSTLQHQPSSSTSTIHSTKALMSSVFNSKRLLRRVTTSDSQQRGLFGSGGGGSTAASTHSTLWSIHSHKSQQKEAQPEFAKTLDALGYPESLKREHDAWSLGAICMCNIGFLQGCLFGSMASLQTGGSSMLSIGWPVSGLFMTVFTASLAELGSAYPFCGAMFTWVWKLCRASSRLRNSARFISWMTGSLLLCGHVLTQILLAFQFAVALQGTILIYAPAYDPKTWYTILIAWAELVVIAAIVSLPISRSPVFWKLLGFEVLFTAVLIIICLLAYRSAPMSTSDIFLGYRNVTGWVSRPYVYLIGWVQTSLATGQDAAFHLAEEAKQPERTVPLACFWSVVVSYALGWVVICVLLGSVPDERFHMLQGQFFSPGQILLQNLPKGLSFTILLFLLTSMLAQGVAQLLAGSRFAWASARDKALPFSDYISRLSPKTGVPLIAVWTVMALCIPGLLLVASSSDFVESLILAGAATTLIVAYALPCLIYLCVKDHEVLDGGWRWTLRSFSKPAAAVGVLFSLFVLIVLCFPRDWPIDEVNLGWAPIVLAVVCALSATTWVTYGNRHYAGPIKILLGPQIELPRFEHALSSPQHPHHTPSEAFGRTVHVLRTNSQLSDSGLESSLASSAAAGKTIATDWSTFDEGYDDEQSVGTVSTRR